LIQFSLFVSIPARASGSLTRKIDEFSDTRMMLKASPNQVLRSEGIHLEVSFLMNGLCDTGQMKHLVNTLYCPDQRGLITKISNGHFNLKTLQPFQIICVPKETTNLDASLNERFDEMASNKPSASSDQNLQSSLPQ
jgi:hypothetical protein